MATMETGARAGMAEFANLPVYIEPQIQTEERKIVRKLIEIPDDLLEAVDANVTASTHKTAVKVQHSAHRSSKAFLPDQE